MTKMVCGSFTAPTVSSHTIDVGFYPKYAFFYIYYSDSGHFEYLKFDNKIKTFASKREYISFTNTGFTFTPTINAYTFTPIYYFCATDE